MNLCNRVLRERLESSSGRKFPACMNSFWVVTVYDVLSGRNIDTFWADKIKNDKVWSLTNGTFRFCGHVFLWHSATENVAMLLDIMWCKNVDIWQHPTVSIITITDGDSRIRSFDTFGPEQTRHISELGNSLLIAMTANTSRPDLTAAEQWPQLGLGLSY